MVVGTRSSFRAPAWKNSWRRPAKSSSRPTACRLHTVRIPSISISPRCHSPSQRPVFLKISLFSSRCSPLKAFYHLARPPPCKATNRPSNSSSSSEREPLHSFNCDDDAPKAQECTLVRDQNSQPSSSRPRSRTIFKIWRRKSARQREQSSGAHSQRTKAIQPSELLHRHLFRRRYTALTRPCSSLVSKFRRRGCRSLKFSPVRISIYGKKTQKAFL
jgi:hypothetical protein